MSTEIMGRDRLKTIIADNVNDRLAWLDRSRYWLAHQTGRQESTIQSVCTARGVCDALLLSVIATALDCTADDLLKERSPKISRKIRKRS